MNGSIYVKIRSRSSSILNIKNDDIYCFFWSILAKLHPCENNSNRKSYKRQNLNQLNINGFDFSNGFRCSDMHKVEKINILSQNIFELNFYPEQTKWKHNIIPMEISKDESDRVVDLLIFVNHYVLIKN